MIGSGNIAQVVGYKIGSLFGAGCLGWLSFWYPWKQLFFLLFAIYIMSAFLVCSLSFANLAFLHSTSTAHTKIDDELIAVHNMQTSNHIQSSLDYLNHSEMYENMNENETNVTSLIERKRFLNARQNKTMEKIILKDKEKQTSIKNDPRFLSQSSVNCVKTKLENYFDVYRKVLASEGTKWTIAYILIYKLGEQGMIAMFPMFLLDHGVSSSDTAMLSGVLCQICSILGSLIGGMLFSYW